MSSTNTSTDQNARDIAVLSGLLDGQAGFSNALTAAEKRGQDELVHSDRLPTDSQDNDAAYIALGFTFGPADDTDPMFRPATLPAGWTRQASDHSMWSHLLDQHGRQRVSIFYKAAFYDRSAFMRLQTPEGYLNGLAFEPHGRLVTGDDWLPNKVALTLLDKLAADCSERAERWPAEAFYSGALIQFGQMQSQLAVTEA